MKYTQHGTFEVTQLLAEAKREVSDEKRNCGAGAK